MVAGAAARNRLPDGGHFTALDSLRGVGRDFAFAARKRSRGCECRVRLLDHPVMLRTDDSDFDVVRQVVCQSSLALPSTHFHEVVMGRYEAMLDRGEVPLTIDCGASIGNSGLWYQWLYPRAQIVAVEPHPATAAILRRNLAGLDGCHVIEAAIGARWGKAAILDYAESWAVRTERAEQSVDVITIAAAAAIVHGATLFEVKIDIEGFESDLFSDNTDWIDMAEWLCLEPHDWMLPGQRTTAWLQAAMGERDFALLPKGEVLNYVRIRCDEGRTPEQPRPGRDPRTIWTSAFVLARETT